MTLEWEIMDRKTSESTKRALKTAACKLLLTCDEWTDVTARAITKEAGVNLAMINYCFGSKEALFFEVFKELQDNVLKCKPEIVEIIKSNRTPKDKLIEGTYQLVKLMLDYFSMSQAVVKFCVLNKKFDLNDPTITLLKEHFGDKKTDGECLLIAYEIESSVELLALRHKEIKEACGIDLTDEEVLRTMIARTINKCLAEV